MTNCPARIGRCVADPAGTVGRGVPDFASFIADIMGSIASALCDSMSERTCAGSRRVRVVSHRLGRLASVGVLHAA